MSQDIKTYNVTIGKVYNADVECTEGSVEIAGHSDVAVNCIDPSCESFTFQTGPLDTDPCLKFIVKCSDCDVCPPVVIERCFCDSIDDCGDCENCVDGFCVPQCTSDQVCVNGTCVECDSDDDCTCNQICLNGSCQCPTGTTLNSETGCCDECSGDEDCSECEVCIGGQCVPKDCGEFVCNPENGICVECLNTGDCGDNECCNVETNICECCPGFVRIDGKCVAVECQTDAECDECFECSNNTCRPITCPEGQLPEVVDGECQCVEECDCDNPGCSVITDYCTDSSIYSGKCVCLPCTQETCSENTDCPEEECICVDTDGDGIAECIGDICRNSPCDTGLDCPVGCGCLNGECVSCYTLSCTGTECDNALGCECDSNGNCGPVSECRNISCETYHDCPIGCTCYAGECVSCDNFPCPDECAERGGCECSGGSCEGDNAQTQSCADSLEIGKVDSSCTITGTLIKDNCCSCPPLTLDIQDEGTRIESDGVVVFRFSANLRKGEYDGVSASANPLLDDFNNPDIAENEPPTSGIVSYTIQYVYDVYNTAEYNASPLTARSSESSTNVNQTLSYTSAGDDASLNAIYTPAAIETHGTFDVPLIDGDQTKVLKEIKILFSKANSFQFPNGCSYEGSQVVGEFSIKSSADIDNLGEQGITIKSEDCRDPLFKWTKSGETEPFRKIYPEAFSDTIWKDIFGGDDGAESCKTYLLDSDCTCADLPSENIVFCNPDDLDFEVTDCFKFIRIKSFESCEANQDLSWRLEAGSIDKVYTYSELEDLVNGNIKIESDTKIEEVKFSLECDTQDVCTITIPTTASDLDITLDTFDCDVSGSTFSVYIPPTDDTNLYSVVSASATINGAFRQVTGGQYLGDFPIDGTHTITVTFDQCDPIEKIVEGRTDCCTTADAPIITRDCSGNVTCAQSAGYTYYKFVNGRYEEVVDICQEVNNLAYDGSLRYQIRVPGCPTSSATTRTISSLEAQGCCGVEFSDPEINSGYIRVKVASSSSLYDVLTEGDITITRKNDGSTASFIIQGNDIVIPIVYASGDPNVTNANQPLIISIDNDICGEVTYEFTAITDDKVDVTQPNNCPDVFDGTLVEREVSGLCTFNYVVPAISCKCRQPSFRVSIDSFFFDGDNLSITYSTQFSDTESDISAGELHIKTDEQNADEATVKSEIVTGGDTIILPVSTRQSTTDCSNVRLDLGVTNLSGNTDKFQMTGEVVTSTLGDFTSPTTTITATQGATTVTLGATAVGSFDYGSPITIETTIVDGSDTYTSSYPVTYNGETSGEVATEVCKETSVNTVTIVTFSTKDLETDDNCSYDDDSVSFTFTNVSSGEKIVSSSAASTILDPTTTLGRYIKVEWYNDTESIQTDWLDQSGADSKGNVTSSLDENLTTRGDEYTAVAICLPCKDEDSAYACCLPTVEADDDALVCDDANVTLTITGEDGEYNIRYNGSDNRIVLPDDSTYILSGPFVEGESGTIQLVGASNCSETFEIDCTPPTPSPTPNPTPSPTGSPTPNPTPAPASPTPNPTPSPITCVGEGESCSFDWNCCGSLDCVGSVCTTVTPNPTPAPASPTPNPTPSPVAPTPAPSGACDEALCPDGDQAAFPDCTCCSAISTESACNSSAGCVWNSLFTLCESQ